MGDTVKRRALWRLLFPPRPSGHFRFRHSAFRHFRFRRLVPRPPSPPGPVGAAAAAAAAAAMGAHLGRRYLWDAEAEPDPLNMPSFPAELGLPGRQPRAMVASAAQLAQARVPLEQRDFCGHHLLRLLRCQRDTFPVPWQCHPLRHRWDSCQHHDYVMRMKEFERERRLRLRQQRLRQRHGDGDGDSE